MRRLTAAALLASILALPGSASATTVRLNWNESAKSGGKVALTFKVTGLVFEQGVWAAAVSFSNRTRVKLRVGRRFGLALFDTKAQKVPTRFLRARYFKPRLPALLAPGQKWTGGFGGSGTPPSGMLVRVVFGPFAGKLGPPLSREFVWLTDHAYRVQAQQGI